jgi:hypothetical protein
MGVSEASDVFEPARGITCDDVIFVDASRTGTGLPGLILMIFPIKDTERRHVKLPTPISARSPVDAPTDLPGWPAGMPLLEGDGASDDPRDAYRAICRYLRRRLPRVPVEARATTPLFVQAGTDLPVTTAYCATMIGEVFAAAGAADDCEYGHAARIGGAQDFHDHPDHGGMAGERLLEERGRWKSDIGFIYRGVSAAQHFAASATLGDHAGTTVRELLTDRWVPNSDYVHRGKR